MVKKISQLAKMAKPKKMTPKKNRSEAFIKRSKNLYERRPDKLITPRDKAIMGKGVNRGRTLDEKVDFNKRYDKARATEAADKNPTPNNLRKYAALYGKAKTIKRYGKEGTDLALEFMSKKKIGGSKMKKAGGGKVVKAKKGGGLFGKLAGMAKPVKKKIMKATAPKDAKKVGAAQKVTKEVFKLTEPKSRRTQAGIRDTKGRLSGVSKKQKKIASAIRVGVPLAVAASLIPKGDKPKIQTAGASSGGSYKIKSGDTLSQIAKRRGTTLKALLAANPSIKNANKIRVGQTIKMSKPVKKRKSVYQGLSKSTMSKMAMPKKKKMGGGKVVKRGKGGSVGSNLVAGCYDT
jgi:LysM repeat protein